MKNMLRTAAALAGLAAIAVFGVQAPASAQQTSPCGYWSQGIWVSTACGGPGYRSSQCGYWNNGVWVAQPCAPPPRRRQAALSGTIVGVNNNLLTVQTGPQQTVLVNDQPALNRDDTGRIYTGRIITAYGHWDGGQFVALTID